MKISLITLHRVFNYGSALQGYATQKLIEKTGNVCEIINYVSEQRTMQRQITYVPQDWKRGSLKGVLYILTRLPNNVVKYRVFSRFWKKRLNLSSRKYIKIEDLRRNPPDTDMYMTGSDQVWNSDYNEGIDHSFFLDFGNQSIPRTAYAASIGMDSIIPEEKHEFFQLLGRYRGITVRETRASELLNDLGIADCPVVLDPTLMLTKEEWQEIEKIPQEMNYILSMVLYGEDCGVSEVSKQLSEKTGLPVVELVWNPLKRNKSGGLYKYAMSPEAFLGYIHNASYVVTNSFHVVAFSVNYQKQFLALKRTMYNSRIESLLNMLNLSGRYIHESEDWHVIEEEIDYIGVLSRLTAERQKSFAELKKLLDLG